MSMRKVRRKPHGPEWFIQRDLIRFLKDREWLVEVMHGNLYQKGIPDLYVAHKRHGTRWIDCKVDGKYSFTDDQKKKWPVWESFGVGIWILTGADQDNYDKLFSPPNWRAYWKESYGEIPDIDALLDELDAEFAN